MRDIKRITIDHKGLPFFDEDGVYVSYEDYSKLEDRLARSEDYCLGVDMERMEYIAKCDALGSDICALAALTAHPVSIKNSDFESALTLLNDVLDDCGDSERGLLLALSRMGIEVQE